jgi:hypothetical protein
VDLGLAVITIPEDVVVSVKGVVDFSVVAVDDPGDVVNIGSEAPVEPSIVVVVVLGLVCVDEDNVGTVAVDAVLDVKLAQLLSSYELW